MESLRDGASTQYGSDAIAGVVNLVLKEGAFSPFGTTGGTCTSGRRCSSRVELVPVN